MAASASSSVEILQELESSEKPSDDYQESQIDCSPEDAAADNGKKHNRQFFIFVHQKIILRIVRHVLFIAYFFLATYEFARSETDDWKFCTGYGFLLIIFVFTYGKLLISLAWKVVLKDKANELIQSTRLLLKRKIRIILRIVGLVAVAIAVISDSAGDWGRLRSASGFFLMLFIAWATSVNRSAISWAPICWSIVAQFFLGFLTLRWSTGRDIFQCLGDKVSLLLEFCDEGSKFLFGADLVEKKIFAFQVLPTILLLSTIASLLYHYGILQSVVYFFGNLLKAVIGTSSCESVICAANIFLGMTEAPLMLQPYLQQLTNSELHCVMAAGFSSVSGSVLAAYVSLGAEAKHLLVASILSAPAALCLAKLTYPEAEPERIVPLDNIEATPDDKGALEVVSNGVHAGLQMIVGIGSHVAAFIALFAALNAFVGWLFLLVGIHNYDLIILFGKVLSPLSYLCGVAWKDAEEVGTLVAYKSLVNEFVAYDKLGTYKNQIAERSYTLATFCLCGFSNPGSLGIMVGGLGFLLPNRKSDIAQRVVRACICGAAACQMTACVAGMLIPSDG